MHILFGTFIDYFLIILGLENISISKFSIMFKYVVVVFIKELGLYLLSLWHLQSISSKTLNISSSHLIILLSHDVN